MRPIHRFIEGLTVMQDKVRSVSFYNSSGENAVFYCDALTAGEQKRLRELGWLDVEAGGASFAEWMES